MYDLVIIGAGPAGLASARDAKALGLRFVLLERRFVGDTIAGYPVGKALFSTPEEIELFPGGLKCRTAKPTREEVLVHYARFVADNLPEVHTGEPVERVARSGDALEVTTAKATYRTRTVLAAVGINGSPKRLNVPGETPERVRYRFVEAYPFAGREVLVAGSGHSAAEAALFLEEVGARVTLAMRRSGFDADPDTGKAMIKWWVREPIEALVAAGKLALHFRTTVTAIGPDDATLTGADGRSTAVPCSAIFALLGTAPDLGVLVAAGVEVVDGLPYHDPETFETNVSGIYVAGHVTREPHIKGAMRVAPLVVNRIAESLAATPR